MDKHLLEYIEIKDFKCFKDFNAKGFKRVNLIGGMNNVGKTAFMEACYINTYSNTVQEFYTVLLHVNYRRNILEYATKVLTKDAEKILFEKTTSLISNSNLCEREFKIIENNGIKEYKFKIDNNENKINVNDFSFDFNFIDNIQYISNYGINNIRLKELFIFVQRRDKEEELYKLINEFDNNILNFKILGGEEPACKVIDRNVYQDINEFGDGLKHYISIICSLYACENGYLFIDEIDNGIHYTQLDRLWEIILTVSKEQNVQVFATTHSKECIESYARVSKKLEDKDISFIELGRNKENKLDSIVMNSERLLRYIEIGNEVRGW